MFTFFVFWTQRLHLKRTYFLLINFVVVQVRQSFSLLLPPWNVYMPATATPSQTQSPFTFVLCMLLPEWLVYVGVLESFFIRVFSYVCWLSEVVLDDRYSIALCNTWTWLPQTPISFGTEFTTFENILYRSCYVAHVLASSYFSLHHNGILLQGTRDFTTCGGPLWTFRA